MLDLAIILLINAFLTLHAIHKETLLYKKRTFTNVFILILVTFSAYMFVAFSVRDNSLDFALDQRGGSYVVFTAEWLTASWVQVMTGYAPGWGGYSNLILELLSRSGLIGMVAYLLGLSFAMMRFYLALFVTVGDDMRALRNNIYMKCWFAFVLMSFVVGNLVNLNIQLPYYTANLLMINVCFVFYYSRYLSETSQVFLTARR